MVRSLMSINIVPEIETYEAWLLKIKEKFPSLYLDFQSITGYPWVQDPLNSQRWIKVSSWTVMIGRRRSCGVIVPHRLDGPAKIDVAGKLCYYIDGAFIFHKSDHLEPIGDYMHDVFIAHALEFILNLGRTESQTIAPSFAKSLREFKFKP